jgi:hypothetical protein
MRCPLASVRSPLDLNLLDTEDLTERGRCNSKAEGNVCLVTGANRNRANEKGNIMNATDFSNIAAGTSITIHTAKGDITGLFVSVNSKGVNLKGLGANAKVISRALSTVTGVTTDSDTPDVPADLFTDGVIYTAAAVAAALDMSAYDLRVQLRNLGMGVGKGRKYGMDAGDARNVYAAIKATPSA